MDAHSDMRKPNGLAFRYAKAQWTRVPICVSPMDARSDMRKPNGHARECAQCRTRAHALAADKLPDPEVHNIWGLREQVATQNLPDVLI